MLTALNLAQYGDAPPPQMGIVPVLIVLVILVVMIAAFWRIFQKAGEAGWQVLIPIWNCIVMLKIAGLAWWWIILLFIPIVNFFVAIYVAYRLAVAFGYAIGFTIGLILLPIIFYPILGFGGAQYQGS